MGCVDFYSTVLLLFVHGWSYSDEKIAQNKTSEEIKNELQNEFGDQILMSAEIKSEFIIWILPFIFGLILAFFLIRKFIKFSK